VVNHASARTLARRAPLSASARNSLHANRHPVLALFWKLSRTFPAISRANQAKLGTPLFVAALDWPFRLTRRVRMTQGGDSNVKFAAEWVVDQ